MLSFIVNVSFSSNGFCMQSTILLSCFLLTLPITFFRVMLSASQLLVFCNNFNTLMSSNQCQLSWNKMQFYFINRFYKFTVIVVNKYVLVKLW